LQKLLQENESNYKTELKQLEDKYDIDMNEVKQEIERYTQEASSQNQILENELETITEKYNAITKE